MQRHIEDTTSRFSQLAWMLEGNQRDYADPMLVSPPVRIAAEDRHPELNASQLRAVDEILLSREKISGNTKMPSSGWPKYRVWEWIRRVERLSAAPNAPAPAQ